MAAAVAAPRLTKYEEVRALAHRVLELEAGYPPLLPEVANGARFLDVALAELRTGLLPYAVVRHAPNAQRHNVSLLPEEVEEEQEDCAHRGRAPALKRPRLVPPPPTASGGNDAPDVEMTAEPPPL